MIGRKDIRVLQPYRNIVNALLGLVPDSFFQGLRKEGCGTKIRAHFPKKLQQLKPAPSEAANTSASLLPPRAFCLSLLEVELNPLAKKSG